MRLEAMVSVGHYQPHNLIHIIPDNEVHDSTGGQQTLSSGVRFSEVAVACGYQSACTISSSDDLSSAMAMATAEKGPHLIHLKIKAGSPVQLGRPTLTPAEIAARFRHSVLS